MISYVISTITILYQIENTKKYTKEYNFECIKRLCLKKCIKGVETSDGLCSPDGRWPLNFLLSLFRMGGGYFLPLQTTFPKYLKKIAQDKSLRFSYVTKN